MAGVTAYYLSHEDESETITEALHAKVGKEVKYVDGNGAFKLIESRQLIDILNFVKEYAEEKVEEVY